MWGLVVQKKAVWWVRTALDAGTRSAAVVMQKIGVPQARVDHVLAQKGPELLGKLVSELNGKD